MFKVGDKVILIEDYHLSLIVCRHKGDKAVVVKALYRSFGNSFIGIKWNKSRDDDGGWWPHRFKLAVQPNEQLEFSFMRD